MYHGSSQKRDNTVFQLGAAFEQCEAGVFFVKIVKRFSQHKYDERKDRNTQIRQKRRRPAEELMQKIGNGNWYTWTGNRKVVKIPENIILPAKEELWLQAYSTNKRSLVQLQDEMLRGLYDVELKETRLFFMPKEAKRKGKIKSVLDRKLSPDRHEFKTTYLNSDRKLQERG